jgi:hypothetical protein
LDVSTISAAPLVVREHLNRQQREQLPDGHDDYGTPVNLIPEYARALTVNELSLCARLDLRGQTSRSR